MDEYRVKQVSRDEIHKNWNSILPLLKRLDNSAWNGTYAKLLIGECGLVLVEKGNTVGAAIIYTIGKHGATDGFNTCFLDVVAVGANDNAFEFLRLAIEKVVEIAKKEKCDGLVGDTPVKKMVDIAKRLGFQAKAMYKLTRRI